MLMEKSLTLEEQIKIISDEKDHLQSENEKLRKEKESLLRSLQNAGELVNRQEDLAAFSESASEIAHEINNPVNFVSSSLSIIRRGVGDFIEIMNMYKQLDGFDNQPLYKKLLELEKDIDVELTKKELADATKTIEKGMERIHEIAYNLSLFGKRETATPVKLNVNQSVADTLMMVQEKVSGQIVIRTELGKIPEIMSYKGKLNQVFTNIIKNAVEAILAKQELHQEYLLVKSGMKDDKVVISVKDTGIGMSEQTRERLFEKFYTTKSSGKGTGLGMGVCKDIIEKHKGSIDVISEKGKGTEIIITLPLTH